MAAAPPPALLVECVGRCLFVGSGDGSLVMLDGESGDIEARLECWGSPLARSLRGNAVGGPLSIHGTSRSSVLPLALYGQGLASNEIYTATLAANNPTTVVLSRFEVPPPPRIPITL